MSNRNKALAIVILGSLVSGAMVPVIKIGLSTIPPFSFSFMRFFLASIVMLPIFLRARIPVNREFLSLMKVSAFAVANVVLFIIGIQHTTASIGQMLYSGTPLLVGVFMFFILDKRMSASRWLAILVGLFGTLLVIVQPAIAAGAPFSGSLMGNGIIGIGIVAFSLYQVFSKKIQKKFSPLVIVSMFFFLSTVVFLFLALSELDALGSWLLTATSTSILSLLFVFFATIVGYLVNQYAIKFGGPVIASLGLYLLPPLAYFYAFILLGEQLTTALLVGTLIVFVSVAMTANTKV